MDLAFAQQLAVQTPSKIIFCVVDGIGGIHVNGKTELQAAHTPHLDKLAQENASGLITPLSPGITVGSGPGHLALFGYDPLTYNVGRGVLAALGVNFPLQKGDLAARINFCTVQDGIVTDRRAGRIATEVCTALCKKISEKIQKIRGVDVFVQPVKQYRAVVVFRGDVLGDALNDTDPQETGLAPLTVSAANQRSQKAAEIVNEFVQQAVTVIKDETPANHVLLRGFSEHEPRPQMQDIFKLTPASIAAYPVYKGVTRLIGMDVLDAGKTFEEEIACLKKNYEAYDFFYVHLKETDSAGEDGNFEKKAKLIEMFDSKLPELLALRPDVLVVTGDHSSPAKLKSHSWHPVPTLLVADTIRADRVKAFHEEECVYGSLGHIQSVDLMPLVMAHAKKFRKYGA